MITRQEACKCASIAIWVQVFHQIAVLSGKTSNSDKKCFIYFFNSSSAPKSIQFLQPFSNIKCSIFQSYFRKAHFKFSLTIFGFLSRFWKISHFKLIFGQLSFGWWEAETQKRVNKRFSFQPNALWIDEFHCILK